MRPAVRRGGIVQAVPRRQRAVLLGPGKELPRLAALEYALQHDLALASIAGELLDAMREIVHGHADVILVLRASDLRPLVRIVTDPDGPVPLADRRQRRTS